jgi:hypothetical protein
MVTFPGFTMHRLDFPGELFCCDPPAVTHMSTRLEVLQRQILVERTGAVPADEYDIKDRFAQMDQ